MRIIDISEENKQTYFLCLEGYHEEMEPAMAMKEQWYDQMKEKGLRVKMAEDDTGDIGGMIQYFPVEESWIKGRDLYFVSCIWVHSNKGGKKNFQNQGMGKALLRAAEEDVRAMGRKGIVVWGTSLPVWMKASWYRKQGYVPVDKKGLFGDVLLWKAFTEDAQPPRWIRPEKGSAKSGGKVQVSCMTNGWCSAVNLSCHRVREVASEFGDQIELVELEAHDQENLKRYGTADRITIDGKKVSTGPPPSKEKIRQMIEKKISRKR